MGRGEGHRARRRGPGEEKGTGRGEEKGTGPEGDMARRRGQKMTGDRWRTGRGGGGDRRQVTLKLGVGRAGLVKWKRIVPGAASWRSSAEMLTREGMWFTVWDT